MRREHISHGYLQPELLGVVGIKSPSDHCRVVIPGVLAQAEVELQGLSAFSYPEPEVDRGLLGRPQGAYFKGTHLQINAAAGSVLDLCKSVIGCASAHVLYVGSQ